MSRRKLARMAQDAEHKRLLRRFHFCPRGAAKAARWKALREFVRRELDKEARQ